MTIDTPESRSRGLFYLTFVSIVWAFSFGLVKTYLGGIPAPFLAFLRLGLATLLFLPWIRWKGLPPGAIGFGLRLGAIQYGLMYCLLFSAFQTLQAHEVVLFTLLTPLYVTLLGDAEQGVPFNPLHLVAAILAVLGAACIKFRAVESADWWQGFLFMQGANFCFAHGQVAYRRFKRTRPALVDHHFYAWVFLGGTALAGVYAALGGAPPTGLTAPQSLVILYLGLVASGLGFFWWNRGAALVANTGLLAVFNNLSIPLGVLASILVFQESTDWIRLTAGSTLMAVSLTVASRR